MFIPAYRDRLRTSVLRHSADAYVGYLIHHQYCPATIRAYLHSIEHFARWVSGLHIPLSSIDESFTHRFVTEHLSVCRCPAPCQCSINSVRPALAHLLHVLREEGDLSGPRSFPPLVQEELERFDIHLDSVCGVAANTRVSRRQWVGKFLTDQFGSAPVDIPRIHSSDIVEFIVRPTNHYRTGTLGVLGSALRSYLRFRAVSCGDKVEALLTAVPTVAKWRLDTVPKHLTTDEVAGLLGAIDQHNPIGRRDYAMARCLLDMGLRVSEVAAIQLDDLNWREGTLTITHGKSRRSDVLPLPVTSGRAIVQYVRGARPPSKSRALFVRHRAPFNTPITVELVRGAIRRAFGRCGLGARYTVAHMCCGIPWLHGCGARVSA